MATNVSPELTEAVGAPPAGCTPASRVTRYCSGTGCIAGPCYVRSAWPRP